MIEQLLNRDYMLAVAAAVAEGVDREAAVRERTKVRRGPRQEDPLGDVTTAELRTFAEALGESPELKPVLAGARRHTARSTRGPERDDSCYIARDPLISIVQSAVEQAVLEHQPDAVDDPGPVTGRGRRTARPVPVVTDRRLKDAPLTISKGRRVWKKFEVATGGWVWLSDPRWAFSLAHKMWRDLTHDFAPFRTNPQTITLADDARVILVGDWGSGLDRAVRVADQIRAELAKGGTRQQVVVHLGDVYYSGTESEYTRRFLEPWPVPVGSDVISLTLPGNHDMYSGGHAYFEHALADPRFARQGGCSYFVLRNDHWQLLGLDSAYEDAGLQGDQGAWSRRQVDDHPDLRTVLLSHHQPFSAHEDGNALLRTKTEPVLATGAVDAWFWGHEHRCIQYGATTVNGNPLGMAGCLGHGGVPEYLVMKDGESKPAPWVWEYLQVHSDNDFEPWGTFGFAVLELSGDTMAVRYIDEDGHEHHTIPAVARVRA